jgi:putative phosphoesterase
MIISIFSDVHGNLINLMSYFDCTSKMDIDMHLCLGDLCNYYPDNKGVIDLIRKNNVTCLLGNHDNMYSSNINLSKEKKLSYNYDSNLAGSAEYLKYLQSLKVNISFDFKKKIFCCHGAPSNNLEGYLYPDSSLAGEVFYDADVFFMGHTHRQFVKEYEGKVFCNVGSIGIPRDDGSLMGFVIYDTDLNTITLYRKLIDHDLIMKSYGKETPLEVIKLLARREKVQYKYELI